MNKHKANAAKEETGAAGNSGPEHKVPTSENKSVREAVSVQANSEILKTRTTPSRLVEQLRKGSTGIVIVVVGISFYFLLLRYDDLRNWLGRLTGILQPVAIGAAIAYLLNPIMNKVEKLIKPPLERKFSSRGKGISRMLGILIAFIIGVLLVYTLGVMVIPELLDSLRGLFVTLPGQIEDLINQIIAWDASNDLLGEYGSQILNSMIDFVENWLTTDLFRQINTIMVSITSGIINVFSLLLNIVVGIVVAIYLLGSKERYSFSVKKGIYAVLGQEKGDFTLHIVKKSNEIFGGFFIGKIVDSLIIGVLCFIGLTILKMPYSLIVSAIIGVTNIIPVFGPYIGAVPSALLIMIADPMKGVYFIIFIIALQQLDGNVIGPKILGDSIGITPFWIMVAILIGGGFFGFMGMLVGVPVTAVILYIVQLFIDRSLKEKNISVEE